MSCNEDEVWNSEAQMFSFEILAPFWTTWWFILSNVFVVLVLLYFLIRVRVSAVKRKSEALQETLRMENEMLNLEQKALRLQMNPHFIFNCLNTIQAMIVKKDNKTARYFLSKFSKLMRKTLDNSRETFISLDDEIESLENYLSIERLCSENHFEYSINVSGDVESDFIQIPPMLIQPFAENAVVHGVSHLVKGGLIGIDFSVEGNLLTCTIKDNGIGREKAKKYNNKEGVEHKSTALIVTQERMELMSKDNHTSELRIEDVLDGDGNCAGTSIILKLSIEE